MLTGNRKKSGTIVAVEISTRALRVLTVRARKGETAVETYESSEIPGESERGRHETLVRNLSALREVSGERRAEIRVALDMPTLLLRNLEFPPMPASEIAGAVKYQWADLTETPPEQMACDLMINAPVASARGDRTEIVLAAVPHVDLEGLLGTFREAGLTPGAVVPAAASLHALRASETRRAGESAELEVIVDIGETRTALALVQGPHFFMGREITTGGGAFTRILQRELDVGPEEAEKLKCLHGIPDPDAPASPDVDESTLRSILFALRPVAERLVGEIERTVAHAREHHGAGRVGRVLLVGGGAKLGGLDRMIGGALEAPAAFWRPRMDSPAGAQGAGGEGGISAVCLGLAAGSPPLNLVSPSALLRPRRRPGSATIGLLGGAVLVLAAGLGWHVWKAHGVAEALAAREARLAAFVTAGGGEAALHPYLRARGSAQIDFTAVFWELDRLAPGGVVIDSLALSRPGENEGSARVLRLGGVAAGATTFAEANLAGFLDSLEASPGFRNIQLVRSASLNRQEGPGLRFGFTCEIAEAPPSGGTGENP